MTSEQKAAYVMSQAAVLIARVAGMQAENAGMLAAQPDQQPVYHDGDFRVLIDESGCDEHKVLDFFNRQ